ncbi:MAG: hypothetical protein H7Y37_06225 [Anaerolineae bacterium]|nr:hypothetical protein [Gloeobacterales cyanobacterium ES-bin-313]
MGMRNLWGSDEHPWAYTSVLSLNCQTHAIDNPYVVDGSFFWSSGAVNPTLTIIANPLRIGDNLIDRMK